MLYSVQAFSGETHNHKESEGANHKHHEDEDRHTQTVYYGLMALMGIIGFLAIERILTIVSDLCSKSSRKTTKVIPEIPVSLPTHIPNASQMGIFVPESQRERDRDVCNASCVTPAVPFSPVLFSPVLFSVVIFPAVLFPQSCYYSGW